MKDIKLQKNLEYKIRINKYKYKENKMEIVKLKELSQKCSEELPNEIDKILQNAKGKKSVLLVLSLPMIFMVSICHGITRLI